MNEILSPSACLGALNDMMLQPVLSWLSEVQNFILLFFDGTVLHIMQ